MRGSWECRAGVTPGGAEVHRLDLPAPDYA